MICSQAFVIHPIEPRSERRKRDGVAQGVRHLPAEVVRRVERRVGRQRHVPEAPDRRGIPLGRGDLEQMDARLRKGRVELECPAEGLPPPAEGGVHAKQGAPSGRDHRPARYQASGLSGTAATIRSAEAVGARRASPREGRAPSRAMSPVAGTQPVPSGPGQPEAPSAIVTPIPESGLVETYPRERERGVEIERVVEALERVLEAARSERRLAVEVRPERGQRCERGQLRSPGLAGQELGSEPINQRRQAVGRSRDAGPRPRRAARHGEDRSGEDQMAAEYPTTPPSTNRPAPSRAGDIDRRVRATGPRPRSEERGASCSAGREDRAPAGHPLRSA